MAKPRRAVPRRANGRILISSTLIGLTAIATFAVWHTDTQTPVALPADEESTLIETASTPTPPPPSPASARPTTTTTTPATPTANTVDWAAIVDGCKATVHTRDTVIARATTGINHWSQHVQAQTDANAGKISITTMQKTFLRTRLLGPTDITRYRNALHTATHKTASCTTPKGAPANIAATLHKCGQRLTAQKPVLTAATHAMTDWNNHLAAMQRNKQTHIHNAQQIWIKSWQSAPPLIKPFNTASTKYQTAPTC